VYIFSPFFASPPSLELLIHPNIIALALSLGIFNEVKAYLLFFDSGAPQCADARAFGAAVS
jgi:hypothetical protein